MSGVTPPPQRSMARLVTEHMKKPRQGRPAAASRMPDQNILARAIRGYLPPAWQYGWRWNALGYLYRGIGMYLLYRLALGMFYEPYTDSYKAAAPKYQFVFTDEGRAVGMAPERVVRQITKARERSKHWREECES